MPTVIMTREQARKIREVLLYNAIGQGEYLNNAVSGNSDAHRVHRLRANVIQAGEMLSLFDYTP